MKNCSFTGHRKIPAYEKQALEKQLETVVRRLLDKGVRNFFVGGALGFDTLAANCVLKIKKEYTDVTLTALLPCADQSKYWGKEDRETYFDILTKCDKMIYISNKYSDECMRKRNDALLERADCIVCFLRKKGSGTAYTVRKAAEYGLKIYPLGIKKEQEQRFIETFLPEQMSFSQFCE